MSSSYTSIKLKTTITKNFRDSFKEVSPKKIGYIFLSKSSEYPNENLVTNLVDTVAQEKEIWNNMLLAKKVIPKDIELVIPRYNWTANTEYKQYDDAIDLQDLLISDVGGEPMYVINLDGDVYKCLCNNVGSLSTVEPTGNFTENDGFIQTSDGYLWKYMYNVKRGNKFFTDEWMPVPYIQANTDFVIYNYNFDSSIDGSLNKIKVTNGGENYYHPIVNVEPFSANTTELTVTHIDGNTTVDLLTTDKINVNMLLSGTGIFENETYITTINSSKPKTLILSQPTISSGGGNTSSNLISILTRVLIEGDGTETITSVKLNSSNQISKIEVVNAGINYTKANVIIYGSPGLNSTATARAILPPKFGHGYNPAIELGASNVMIISRIGEIDATENQILPTDINFRQYGLLVNPYKYDGVEPMNENNSLDVVSQTLDLTLLSFSNFQIGEMVYQGNINDPTFIGYVVQQESNIVKLNNVYKTPNVGTLLIGLQSVSRNPILSVKNPDLKPYTGDVLFARNILKVQRSVAQAEEVKLIFQF